jgi:hypothetical protein
MVSAARYFLCTGECVKYEDLHLYADSHIIGELRYVVDEGRKVTALARYDVSVSASLVPPIDPEIDVLLVGDAREIKCRAVGCVRKERWEIGKAAFMQLMQRYGKVV